MQDLPAIEQASQDASITSVTSVPSPYTLDEGRAFIEPSSSVSGNASRTGAGYRSASLMRIDTALGFIGLRLENRASGRASFGYWVVPAARGRDVATAAARLVSPWAFATLGVARLEIVVDPSNMASVRVAEQAGFRREGLLRAYEEYKGQRLDIVMHARIIGD